VRDLFPCRAFDFDLDQCRATNFEAFRVARFVADTKAFDALCAAELSYSHSDGHRYRWTPANLAAWIGYSGSRFARDSSAASCAK
jgi:hypothetical protein